MSGMTQAATPAQETDLRDLRCRPGLWRQPGLSWVPGPTKARVCILVHGLVATEGSADAWGLGHHLWHPRVKLLSGLTVQIEVARTVSPPPPRPYPGVEG